MQTVETLNFLSFPTSVQPPPFYTSAYLPALELPLLGFDTIFTPPRALYFPPAAAEGGLQRDAVNVRGFWSGAISFTRLSNAEVNAKGGTMDDPTSHTLFKPAVEDSIKGIVPLKIKNESTNIPLFTWSHVDGKSGETFLELHSKIMSLQPVWIGHSENLCIWPLPVSLSCGVHKYWINYKMPLKAIMKSYFFFNHLLTPQWNAEIKYWRCIEGLWYWEVQFSRTERETTTQSSKSPSTIKEQGQQRNLSRGWAELCFWLSISLDEDWSVSRTDSEWPRCAVPHLSSQKGVVTPWLVMRGMPRAALSH